MPTKHITASTTAAIHTLTKSVNDSTIRHLVVVNIDGGSTAAVYFTIATNGEAPVTAVAEADDTLVASAGAAAVPILVGPTDEVKVSIISASGSPKVALLAG